MLWKLMACVRNHMFSVGEFDVCVCLLERISVEWSLLFAQHTVPLLCFIFHTHCCRWCCFSLSCFSICTFAPTNGVYPARYINEFSTVAFLQLPPSTETIHNEHLSTSLTPNQNSFHHIISSTESFCAQQIQFEFRIKGASTQKQKDIRIISVWKCSLKEFHQNQSTFFSLTKCFDVSDHCVCCFF